MSVGVFCDFQLEEKARLEAEAREREMQQQLLEEQRRRQEEEEEALKQELLRLKAMRQLRSAKKKKKESRSKEAAAATAAGKPETPSPAPAPTNNPQPLRQTAQNVLENMQNGKAQLLHGLLHLAPKEPRLEPETQSTAKNSPSPQQSPKSSKEKPIDSPALPNGTLLHPELANIKVKSKHQPNGTSRVNGEAHKKPPETPRAPEATPKVGTMNCTHTETKAKPKVSEELPSEARKEERSSGKKQQNGAKEERNSPIIEPPAVEAPQQNGKVVPAESPQPKGKAKKNKKKKADKMNNSIGERRPGCAMSVCHV